MVARDSTPRESPSHPAGRRRATLKVVSRVLQELGIAGWLVGGSVRDLGLGLSSPDLDVVVGGDAALVAGQVARATERPWFALSERHGAYRVVGSGWHVDVAALRGATILEDLALRDFTVNAMALPLALVSQTVLEGALDRTSERLIDPYGGFTHLQKRRLVAVSPDIFQDDPLRLLRAVRFCHVLDFTLDPALETRIREQAKLLDQAAPERIASELALTLEAGRAGAAVRQWERLGLLEVLLPGAFTQADTRNSDSASGEVQSLTAVLAVLDNLEDLLRDPEACSVEAGPLLAARLRRPLDGLLSRPVALRLAGLLGFLEEPRVAELARKWRLSSRFLSLGCRVARTKVLQGVSVPTARDVGRPGREAVRFLWRAAPWEPEVILLARAAEQAAAGRRRFAAARWGSLGSGSPGSGSQQSLDWGEEGGGACSLLRLWAHRVTTGAAGCPLDGETLQREIGLPPGPELGRILTEVKLAWEAGELRGAEQALALARERMREKRSLQ